MIAKINKIKNLGLVFSNYTWNNALAAFKRVNLVYGWNGCGKTSFSRLFDSIGGMPIKDLEYEIEDEHGTKYRQGEPFLDKIRVFNQDYIQKNVRLLEGRANSISILLGAENKELMEEIEADRKLLEGDPATPGTLGKIASLGQYQKEKRTKSGERDGKFTEIAKTIGAAIGGKALRDYRKPQAEKDFTTLTKKVELSEEELRKYSLSAKQESLSTLDPLTLEKIIFADDKEQLEISNQLKSITEQAQALLGKTVESEVIARLASNKDISQWVEQGILLHRKHSSNACEYCLQPIPTGRIDQLARHFNEADRAMKEAIDALVAKLESICLPVKSLQAPDKARFYADLQGRYENMATQFESAKQQLVQSIGDLIGELKGKKSRTTEALILKTQPSTQDLLLRIKELNQVIETHNNTTKDFEAVRGDAVQKLKGHYLSTIFDAVKQCDTDVAKCGKDIELVEVEIADVQKHIAENMAQVSSKHKACEVINKMLTTFLGHQELTFTPHAEKEAKKGGKEQEVVTGYDIMRGDKPAIYLSEGEKTAIAFVYFVVQLGDQDFNVPDGIVVVDDPISSLDSNSLYQAFSFLKNAVKDAKQVFILTHSFDFLKLLMNWRRSAGGAGYYMIKNHFPADIRCAYLDKMDKELCEYESEYHYLFKLLKQLRDEQDGSIAKAYPIPNVARKVWDTFLMFSVPNGKSQYKKMDELKKAGFDEQKLDAVYKFTNDQSHITGAGFNPALVPETKKS